MEGIPPGRSFMDIFKAMRAADDHKRRRAATEKRRAAIEKERSLVRDILAAEPTSTQEIAQKLDLTPDRVRLRVHQLGGVPDGTGRWRLAESEEPANGG